MINELIRERKRLNENLKQIKEEHKRNAALAKNVKCKVSCRMKGKHPQYYLDDKYVKSSELDKVAPKVLRDFDAEIIPILENRIDVIENAIAMLVNDEPDRYLRSLSPGRQRLIERKSIYKSKEQIIQEFENQVVPEYEAHPIDTEIYTAKGEKVRSKSEKIIADELYHRGIPYKYELPITLIDKERAITIRPDFTVLNKSTLRKFYIEHLGMMSDETYFTSSLIKLSTYEKNNILIGRDLLLFHETLTRPLNTTIVNEYITEFLE